MSLAATKWAWGLNLPTTQKIVLLCIADFAGKDGTAWPTANTIGSMCGLSRRAVMQALVGLKDAGHIATQNRKKDGLASVYFLSIDVADHVHQMHMGGTRVNPPPCAPNAHAPNKEGNRVNTNTRTPDGDAFHFSESKMTQKRKNPDTPEAPTKRADCPHDIDPELWAEWLSIRKTKRAPPPTERALMRLRAEATEAGLSLHDAITMCCDRCWISLQAGWVRNPTVSQRRAQPMTQDERIAEAYRIAFGNNDLGALGNE